MTFVRQFDPALLSPDRFDYQILADFESCVILGARLPTGTDRGGRHKHVSDQLYYVVSGSLDLEVDGRDYVVPTGSVGFVPAGLPHSSRNRGAGDEVHIDVMVPAPPPGSGFSSPVADGQKGSAHGSAIVRNVDPDTGREPIPGFMLRTLADHSTGCNMMAVRLAEMDPAVPGTQWHIHEFDQFYFVLEGLLMVEVANKRFAVEPLSLVALPAGIPHRNWNGGDGVERHVAILVPEPERGVRADIAVEFSTVTG